MFGGPGAESGYGGPAASTHNDKRRETRIRLSLDSKSYVTITASGPSPLTLRLLLEL